MYSILYTAGMAALWAVSLLNGTGLGAAYRTTEYARLALLVIAVVCLGSGAVRDRGIFIPRRYFYVGLAMVATFAASSFLNGRNFVGLEYLSAYLVVYILSLTKPTHGALRLTGICYGVLGLAILYFFSYTDLMKGWNGNSIAMIGLFSFLVFMIPFFGMRDGYSILFLPAVGAAYVFLIWPTDSRSCIITIVIALVVQLRFIPIRTLLRSSKGLLIALLVPLFVAILGTLMAAFADLNDLAKWMSDTFGKTLFSGRDEIWRQGFDILKENPLLGTGVVDAGTWHNSAVACLVAFGVVGYALWIKLFHTILKDGQPFIWDTCVAGSMAAFLVLSFQQSFELGLFSPAPNLIPYAILGVLLGRVNYLRSGSNGTGEHHRSHL